MRKPDKPVACRAFDGIERLASDGIERLGTLADPTGPCKALAGPLVGLWRLRVGDYRVILDVRRGQVFIVALDVGHRSVVDDD